MAEIEKKWYVLRAISGKEAKVKEYLEADLKNSDLGEYVSQVLIPTEKVYQVRNGKKIVKERSYLPGYVLVEAALVGEVAHHLRNTPNVIGFLGGSEKPVPLRQSEVNRILGTVDELQETGEELNIPYVVGETVKVTFGPFSGFSWKYDYTHYWIVLRTLHTIRFDSCSGFAWNNQHLHPSTDYSVSPRRCHDSVSTSLPQVVPEY